MRDRLDINDHFKDDGSKNDFGFSLIEVLAAMVIFTVAILGLSHAGSESVRGIAAIEAKTLGSIVADNQLTLARFERVKAGTRRGETTQMGRKFEWRVETEETPVDNFFQLRVSVLDPNTEAVYVTRMGFVRNTGQGLRR